MQSLKPKVAISKLNVGPAIYEQDLPDISDSGLSVVETLRKHVGLILSCALICFAASVVYLRFQKPVYEATAVIRIDPGRASSLGVGDLFSGPTGEQNDAMHTEIAILKGDAVTVETLNSLSNEQFRKFVHNSSERKLIPEDSDALPPFDETLISQVQSSTTVRQQEGTQLLDVRFRDNDPQVAAMMANQIVTAYSLQSFKSRGKSVDQLRTYLVAQMDELQQKLEESQKKLANFLQENEILGPSGEKNTITDRLASLNEKLTNAQAARISIEAQVKAAHAGNPAALANLFPSPGLTRLQDEEGAAEAEVAQLSAKFGPNYQPLVQKRKQVEVLTAQIANDVEPVKAQLQQQYQAALTNESMLQSQYKEQAKRAYNLNSSQVTYATLQADVSSSRQLYDMLQRKLEQAEVDTQVSSISTLRVGAARAPLTPVEPKKPIILATGLLIGLFAGVATAFIFEMSSDRVRTAESIQRVIGVPALVTIPSSARVDQGPLNVLTSPRSPTAEAYRALRNLVMAEVTPGRNAVLFACATPDEGMVDVVANVAATLAQTGAKVLLVDADLRQPSLHVAFGISKTPGLGDFIAGTSFFVSNPVNSVPSLFVVTAGTRPVLSSEALASQEMKGALESWKSTFEYVILLAPPLLTVSDGMPLAKWSDVTVLVTKYGVSRMGTMRPVKNLLRQSGANVAGFVMLDAPKFAGTFTGQTLNAEDYYA